MQHPSEQASPEDRVNVLKHLLLTVSWLPVVAIAAPLINVYFNGDTVWIALIMMLAPMFLMVRGVRALLYPEERPVRPYAVFYGVVAVMFLLAVAPMSIKMAMKNITVRPTWIALSLTGVVASVVYLGFAYRYWKWVRQRRTF